AMACTFCGTRCQCPNCAAPLSVMGRSGPLHCRVCGRREDGYRCPECDRTQVRAMVIGSTRTAEELHRAFPETVMRIAGGAHGPLDNAEEPERGIVVTTPGAEPAPGSRYAAALLLDADAMLGRAAFDADVDAKRRWRNAIALIRSADEVCYVVLVGTATLPWMHVRPACDADVEAVRRWRNAIALVRSADEGGEVLVVGTSTLPAIRELVAHRSSVFLDRVLADRQELDLPPFTRVAEVTGDKE